MGDSRGIRDVQRPFDVREDWLAPLPGEKNRCFEAVRAQLESSYRITSIALNDVLTLRQEDRLPPASEQSAIVGTLFDGLAQQLQGVLRSLGEHARHFGTVAVIIPLRPGFFRGVNAQRTARNNHLVCRVLFSVRARFFRKVRALLQIVGALKDEASYISRARAKEIAQSWSRLEELHYDLNTCLCETTVVLKSFIWVLPDGELGAFQTRLDSHTPAPRQFFLDERSISRNNDGGDAI